MTQYETGVKLVLLNIALGLGTFIQVLDTSIANVAIPYIAGNLSVSADQGTWVITSFAASNAIVLPLTGWLSNYFGRVRLFVWSVFLFAIVSALCGLSSNLTMLVIFRVIQGAVAGSLIPLSQSLIVTSNPPERRGAALGFWAMVVIIAPILGYLVYFGGTVTLPLWIQTEQGYTAFWAGVAIAPIGVIPVMLSSQVGKYMHLVDLRLLVALSFLFFAISFFLQSNFTTEVSLQKIMWTRFIQGFGVAIFFLPLVQLSLGEIPSEKYASASGLFNFIRILIGSGFGTSLSIQLWTRLEIFHHARLSESISSYRPQVTEFYRYLENKGSRFSPDIVTHILDQHVENQAFMLSTNDIAWMAAWLCVLIIPLVFLCKRVKPSETTQSVAH